MRDRLEGKFAKPFLSDDEACAQDAIIIRLGAVGQRWVNGVSTAYDSTFPSELEGHVTPDDFQRAIEQINNTMKVCGAIQLYCCCY
jgi:hypothetical protein